MYPESHEETQDGFQMLSCSAKFPLLTVVLSKAELPGRGFSGAFSVVTVTEGVVCRGRWHQYGMGRDWGCQTFSSTINCPMSLFL